VIQLSKSRIHSQNVKVRSLVGNLIERQDSDTNFKIIWGAPSAIATASGGKNIEMRILARIGNRDHHDSSRTSASYFNQEEAVHQKETVFISRGGFGIDLYTSRRAVHEIPSK
jgi:hypothetical protein